MGIVISRYVISRFSTRVWATVEQVSRQVAARTRIRGIGSPRTHSFWIHDPVNSEIPIEVMGAERGSHTCASEIQCIEVSGVRNSNC
jgi:hypothetical protein